MGIGMIVEIEWVRMVWGVRMRFEEWVRSNDVVWNVDWMMDVFERWWRSER